MADAAQIEHDWLEVGVDAPDFELERDGGAKVRLSELRGQAVVLYFYPADDTPGCTKEACAFRDSLSAFTALGALVFGVSPDDAASHNKFRDKFSLNFPLLADPDHQMAESYGAWREKNNYGKKYMGVVRSTYVIDSAGKVSKVWKRVSVDGHEQQVLEHLRTLGQP